MGMVTKQEVKKRYRLMKPVLNERSTRIWAGTEALAAGPGGVMLVAAATGLSRSTVGQGKVEAAAKKPPADLVRIRRKGAGPPFIEERQPGIWEALDALVDPVTRGDPESPLRWTSKSTRKLSAELETQGFKVSQHKVAEMLREKGYSLQATSKSLEGESHPDRDAQFRHISSEVTRLQAAGQPTISVDTKKKELVGEFHNNGGEWQPKGAPVLTLSHDFPDTAIGKAIPYGVYDVGANNAWVSIGTDHDTPVFAVNSIRTWWKKMGAASYPDATELLVMADAGGSNSYRSRVWKTELQNLATETGLAIGVMHFPPGTSKWNKIEHRLFSHISMNWRGRPLEDYETVVQLIGTTKTATGLSVRARLDRRKYATGRSATDAAMRNLNIAKADFHGEWNYKILPTQIM